MSLSDGLIILGSIALFVYIFFIWGIDALGITLDENDFVVKIIPYFLLIGLITLGSGVGIKVYRWKNSSR